MRGLLKLHLLAFTLFIFSSSASAQSPSFDCHYATTPREQTICTNPDLAALDLKLSAAYKSTLTSLTPISADQVRSDQREWLHWLNRVCTQPPFRGQTAAECLTNFYNDRLKELTTNSQKIDAAFFYPRAHYVFIPGDSPTSPPASDDDPNYGYGEFAWPQIDNPTPAQQAWNQAVQAAAIKVACCSEGTTKPSFNAAVDDSGWVVSDYTLASANSRLITVNLTISTYGWGAAHPLSAQTFFTWWLDLQRPLKSTDVFAPNAPWQQKLAALTLAKLLNDPGPDALWKQGTHDHPGDLEKAVARGVTDPKSWALSSQGLTLNFGSYEVGPYSSGWPSALIPWQDLSPQLNPTLNPTTLPPPIPTPR